MLYTENIDFAYKDKKILSNLSFSIQKGEMVSLIGASGSGKTTLFRLITGLLRPDKGTIVINGTPFGTSDVTYMQQEDLLLPWRDVLGNLLLITELWEKRPLRSEIEAKAMDILQQVGLKGYEYHYPHELSGGMRQRVALARALLQNRPILLLDEPFGSLDVIIREELYALIRSIADERKITLLFVTHDFRDAFSLSDKIFVLNNCHICKTYSLSFEIKNDPLKREKLFSEIREQLLYQSSV